jgi:hypothetical protein
MNPLRIVPDMYNLVGLFMGRIFLADSFATPDDLASLGRGVRCLQRQKRCADRTPVFLVPLKVIVA